MKFSRHLSSHLTPEWYPQYINYEKMKTMLYRVKSRTVGIPPEQLTAVFADADEGFLEYCRRELEKIQDFYVEKLSEAKRKLISLNEELEIDGDFSASLHSDNSIDNLTQPHFHLDKHKLRSLKLAFSELYLLLILIQNFQSLNCTGFRKILKKHDKLFITTRGGEWNKQYVLPSHFATDKSPVCMIEQVEDIFTYYLEYGDRPAAMKALRVPRIGEKIKLITSFRLGILIGMVTILTPLLTAFAYWINKNNKNVPWQLAIRLYRSIFLVILQVCLTGINILGWSQSGVNHVLIFELDPRIHLNYQQILEIGFFFFLLYEISIACFLVCSYINRFSLLNPLIFCIIILALMLNPSRFLYWRARKWLISSCIQVFSPCVRRVEFRHFWLGDQLTSQSLLFHDSFFFLFFYTLEYSWKLENSEQSNLLRPKLVSNIAIYIFACIFSLLPHIARFAQCIRRFYDYKTWFPHVPNACKYLTSFPVVIMTIIRPKVAETLNEDELNTFTYIFIIFALIESSYKLAWDLKMDWGLMERKYSLIREVTVYNPLLLYYLAIIENCLLRFAWMLKILLRDKFLVENIFADIGFCALEIIRRFVWNFFRLENEHVNNCGEFRAVRDISVVPMKQSIPKFINNDTLDLNDKNSKNFDEESFSNL